jgi:hypothetical protein
MTGSRAGLNRGVRSGQRGICRSRVVGDNGQYRKGPAIFKIDESVFVYPSIALQFGASRESVDFSACNGCATMLVRELACGRCKIGLASFSARETS